MHNGITLIEVPYWWDFSKERLTASIKQVRPDLIPNMVNEAPIPTEMPMKKDILSLNP